MRYFIALMVPILFLFSSAVESQTHIPASFGVSFDIPAGWTATSSDSNQIILALDSPPGISIIITKNLIAREYSIGSIDDLESALLGFYRDLDIENYPGDSLVYELRGNRADFEITYNEETNNDSLSHITNILKGIIVRASDGRQWFYLFQAAAPEKYREQLAESLETITNSFKVEFPSASRLYRRKDLTPYLLILLVLALTAFFYARNRRVQKSRHPLGLDSNSFWRCVACGKVNHLELPRCRRCGHDREKVGSINSRNR